jgi:hypothetical protein
VRNALIPRLSPGGAIVGAHFGDSGAWDADVAVEEFYAPHGGRVVLPPELFFARPETAGNLGISNGAVKSHASRAAAALRTSLGPLMREMEDPS